jgi:hypothetical protein
VEEGRRQGDVGDDGAPPDLLAREERVRREPDALRATVGDEDPVDGAGRPDVAAVRQHAPDQRVGERVRAAPGRVHGHGGHAAQAHDHRPDPAVERPLPRELAERGRRGADLLGLEEHLEDLEAAHPLQVVAGERAAEALEQAVVEDGEPVEEPCARRAEEEPLVQLEHLEGVLARVLGDLRLHLGIPGRYPREALLGHGLIEGLDHVLPVGERLREQHVGAEEVEAEALEVEVRHGRAHRGDQPGGVRVVQEARDAELHGVAVRAALPARLEDRDRHPRLGEVRRDREAVDAAADHDDVVVPHRVPAADSAPPLPASTASARKSSTSSLRPSPRDRSFTGGPPSSCNL